MLRRRYVFVTAVLQGEIGWKVEKKAEGLVGARD